MNKCGITLNALIFAFVAALQILRFVMSREGDTIVGIYSEIIVCFCLYGFRVYMLTVINVFEADFELKTRLINNNTQIELVGFDKITQKQLFRVILEASGTGHLN